MQSLTGQRLRRLSHSIRLLIVSGFLPVAGLNPPAVYAEWIRHTIDDSSRGADGIRLGDVNHDGFPDLVTGWEEGGEIRVCLNPGPKMCRNRWTSLRIGAVKSPEDAVFVDVDGDGQLDVVSSCEGRERTLFIHWNPAAQSDSRLRTDQPWPITEIPGSRGLTQWMFVLPDAQDESSRIRLFAGSKGPRAAIGVWSVDSGTDRSTDWNWRTLRSAGWIMSLQSIDMDDDGDLDLLFTDRRGAQRGCSWLQRNTSPITNEVNWKELPVCGQDHEVMFLATGDVDGDQDTDIAVATRGGPVLLALRQDNDGTSWKTVTVPMPESCGTGKGVAIADLDLDGHADLAVTCENAGQKHGVLLMPGPLVPDGLPRSTGSFTSISGPRDGIKFDLIQLLDLDQDGDLDLLTCEERDNLGVIWYENPTRDAIKQQAQP